MRQATPGDTLFHLSGLRTTALVSPAPWRLEDPSFGTRSVLEGVVSLLVTFVLIYPSLLHLRADRTFGERWALPEPVLPRAFGRVEGSRNRLRAAESCDYTYLYNRWEVSSLHKIWQRPRFSTSLGWTLSSWLRGRFRGQNRILQRRNSGRVFRGSSSIRPSTVFSTIWRAPTR